ncbi:MAG: hypothetical protein CMD07_02160 [Flavobacteriales bacterium]|nr:hypothetical protein [Flavobacteriales bacterium]|tara:strand:+ start:3527 stop:3943 length:417 start_codon:yes stop_codon:yes gene_type:complete
MIKKILIPFIIINFSLDAQNSSNSYEELLEENPFNSMYPKFMAFESSEYFKTFNKLFSDETPIPAKEARLAAISASAAMRCEYCIFAQVKLAKDAGASEEEIKSAIQIAAEVQRFSTLLYGNEFGFEKLSKIINKEEE